MQISCKTNATFHGSTTRRRKLSGEREELLGMSEGVHRGVGARRRGDHDGFGLLLFLEDEQARMVSRLVEFCLLRGAFHDPVGRDDL